MKHLNNQFIDDDFINKSSSSWTQNSRTKRGTTAQVNGGLGAALCTYSYGVCVAGITIVTLGTGFFTCHIPYLLCMSVAGATILS